MPEEIDPVINDGKMFKKNCFNNFCFSLQTVTKIIDVIQVFVDKGE